MAVVDDLGQSEDDVPPPSEDFGRQPPQDEAAEQAVLGGMLLSKDAIADVLERLRPGDFYRPAHQIVYDAILDLYGRGEPADAVTVAAELDRRGLLRRIGGRPVSAHPDLHRADGGQRRVLRGHRRGEGAAAPAGGGGHPGRAVRLCGCGRGRCRDVVDRAQAEIYDVTDGGLRRLRAWKTAAADDGRDRRDRVQGDLRGVPTGSSNSTR